MAEKYTLGIKFGGVLEVVTKQKSMAVCLLGQKNEEVYAFHLGLEVCDDGTIIQRMVPVGIEKSRLPILEYDPDSGNIVITFRSSKLTMEEVVSRDDFVGGRIEYQIGDHDFQGEIAAYEYQDGKLQLRLFPAYRRDHLEGESQSLYDEWYSNCLLDKSESCFQIENLREEPDGKVSFTAKEAVGRVIIAFKPKE